MEPSKLASLPFFQGISPEDMTKLLEELDAREVFYEKGSFLVHTGDKITAAGLVLSGEVHILREDFWGSRALVAQIPSGAFFGETYALLDTAAEVSVLAAADTTVLYLSLNRILAPTGQQNPLFTLLSRRLLQIFAGRNLTLTERLPTSPAAAQGKSSCPSFPPALRIPAALFFPFPLTGSNWRIIWRWSAAPCRRN